MSQLVIEGHPSGMQFAIQLALQVAFVKSPWRGNRIQRLIVALKQWG